MIRMQAAENRMLSGERVSLLKHANLDNSSKLAKAVEEGPFKLMWLSKQWNYFSRHSYPITWGHADSPTPTEFRRERVILTFGGSGHLTPVQLACGEQ